MKVGLTRLDGLIFILRSPDEGRIHNLVAQVVYLTCVRTSEYWNTASATAYIVLSVNV